MHKLFFTAIFAAALTLTSCGKRVQVEDSPTSGTEFVACDESFEQVFEQEIDVFEYNNPKATIMARYLPEAACVDSLMDGKVRLAVITRELSQVDIDYLKSQRRTPVVDRIAVDAIAIIANPDNPIESLSLTDLQQILAGEITQWEKVEPFNKSGKINVVFDYDNSSTVSCVKEKVMDGKPFGSNVYAQRSNKKVLETVAAMRGAIGIIGVSWISSDMNTVDMTAEQRARQLERNDTTVTSFNPDIKVLAISPKDSFKAVKPYQAYIYDGSYPLFRSVYLVSIGSSGSLARGFANFVKGFAGQKLIQQTGVLPGTMQPRIVQIE